MSEHETVKNSVLSRAVRHTARDEKGGTAVMFGLALMVFFLFTAFAIDLVTQSMKFEKGEATMRQISQPAALSLARLEVRRLLNDSAPLTGDLLPNLIGTEEAVHGPLLDYMKNRYEKETGKTLAETKSCITAFIRRNSNNEMIFQSKLEVPKPDAVSSAVGIRSADGACSCSNSLEISAGCQGHVAGWVVNPSLDERVTPGVNPGNPVPGGPGTPPSGSVWDVNIQFVVDLGEQQTGAVVSRVGQIVDGFEDLMGQLRSGVVINRIQAGANFYQLQATVDDANIGGTGAGAGGGCTYDDTMSWEGCGWSPTENYSGTEGGPGQCVQHRAFPLVAEFLAQHTRYCGGDEAVWTHEPKNEGGSCYRYHEQQITVPGFSNVSDAQTAANNFCASRSATCVTKGSPPASCECAVIAAACTGYDQVTNCSGDTNGDNDCDTDETSCSCSTSNGNCNAAAFTARYYFSSTHNFRTMHWFHSCPKNITDPNGNTAQAGMFRSPELVMEARAVYKGPLGTTTNVADGPVFEGTIARGSMGFRQDETDFVGMKDPNSKIHMNFACDTAYDAVSGEWGYAYGRETSRDPASSSGCFTSVNSLPGNPKGVNRYTVTFMRDGCGYPNSLAGCDMPLGRYSIELRAVGLKGAMSVPGNHNLNDWDKNFQGVPGPTATEGCSNCADNEICPNGDTYKSPRKTPVDQWGKQLGTCGGNGNCDTGLFAPTVVHDPIPAEQLYIASLSAESGARIGGAIIAGMYENFASEKAATDVTSMGYPLQSYPARCINSTNYSNVDYIWYGTNRAPNTEVNLSNGCSPMTQGVAVLNPNYNNQWVPTGVKNTYTEDDTPGQTAHYLGCGPGVDTCNVSSNRSYSNALGIGCSRNRLGMRVRNIPFQALQVTKAAISINSAIVDRFNGTGSAAMCYASAIGAEKLVARAGSNVLNIFVGMLNCPIDRNAPSLKYNDPAFSTDAIMDFWPQTWQAGLPGTGFRLAGYSLPAGELDDETMTCLSQVKSRVEGSGGLTWIYNACPDSSEWAAQMRAFGSDDGSPGTFPSWTGCNPSEDIARCIFSLWDTIVRDKVMLIDQTSDLTKAPRETQPGEGQTQETQPGGEGPN